MAKKRKCNDKGTTVYFETIRYKSEGRDYVVYLCRRCSRAWKYADPVEAWRINSLLSHARAHDVFNAVALRLGVAAPDRVES